MYKSINLEIQYTPNAAAIIIKSIPIIGLSSSTKYPTKNIIVMTAIKNNNTKNINGYLNHFGVFKFLLNSNEPSNKSSITNSIISSIISLPSILYHDIMYFVFITYFAFVAKQKDNLFIIL